MREAGNYIEAVKTKQITESIYEERQNVDVVVIFIPFADRCGEKWSWTGRGAIMHCRVPG